MSDPLYHALIGPIIVGVPVMALYAMRLANLRVREFTIPSFLVIVYLVTVYVGCVILAFGWDAYARSVGATDPVVTLKVLAFGGVGLLTIVGGFVFANRVVGLSAPIASRPYSIGSTPAQRWLFLGLFLTSCTVLALYLSKVEVVALSLALRGDALGAAVARSTMGNAFAGTYWRYHLFFRHMMDLCVLYFFADYVLRRKVAAGALAAVSLLVAAFSATMSVEKGPLVKLLVMLYLVYLMTSGGAYWQRQAKYLLPVLVALSGAMYVYFMGIENYGAALHQVGYRVFTGQVLPAYFYVDRFPREVGYLWGASFPNPGGLLPFEPYRLTLDIAQVISPGNAARGVVGSAPTVFWAEMYANFGPAGVFLSGGLVGIGAFVIAHVLGRLPLSPPTVATTAFFAMHYRGLTGTGLSAFLVDEALFSVVVVLLIAVTLGRREGRVWRVRRGWSGTPSGGVDRGESAGVGRLDGAPG